MSVKRILILNWRCPKNPLAGGAEMITLEHARAWVDAGFHVTWFAERFGDAPDQEVIEGVDIERIAPGNKMHSIRAPFVYVVFLWQCIYRYWTKHRGNFDLVMDEVHGPSLWITLWAWKSKKLIYVHEVARDIWDKMLPFPLNVLGKTVEKCMYFFYRTVPFLTASESTKSDLVAYGIPSRNITVIPHGLGLKPLATPVKKEPYLTLVFVARLVKMKGVEDAIDVLARLVKTHPKARLWIVGKGTDKYVAMLHQKVTQLELEDAVVFMGHVSEAKKITLYQKAHLLIHTSVREGFGLVVIEANSQETPAIVYDSPGLRDLVVDGVNGFILPYGRIDTMAETVSNVFENKNSYQKLQKSSIEYSRDFQWKTITSRSIKLINHILAH